MLFRSAISRAQAAFPNERPAESGGGGEGGVAGTVSRGTPSGGSLARTNWALILQEQLPLSSALELPEAPASATTSLEVPVVITEEAAPEVK